MYFVKIKKFHTKKEQMPRVMNYTTSFKKRENSRQEDKVSRDNDQVRAMRNDQIESSCG